MNDRMKKTMDLCVKGSKIASYGDDDCFNNIDIISDGKLLTYEEFIKACEPKDTED